MDDQEEMMITDVCIGSRGPLLSLETTQKQYGSRAPSPDETVEFIIIWVDI